MAKDVKVRLLDAPSFLDKPYTYSVPEALDAEVNPGCFVTLPFGGGNRRHVALVTERTERDPNIGTVKPIHALSHAHTALTPDMLALAGFLCEQTLCTMGEAVHAMLPAGVLGGLCARYRVTDRPVGDVRRLSTDEAFLYAHLAQNGECSEDALRTRFGTQVEEMLDHLVRLKLASRELVQKNAAAVREIVTFSLCATREHVEAILSGKVKGRMGEKQKLALSLLLGGDQTADALREAGCTKAQTDALVEKGLITRRSERQYRDLVHAARAEARPVEHPLSEEQKSALAEIERLAHRGKGYRRISLRGYELTKRGERLKLLFLHRREIRVPPLNKLEIRHHRRCLYVLQKRCKIHVLAVVYGIVEYSKAVVGNSRAPELREIISY